QGRTPADFELNFAVNHLGHFAWTGLLLPCVLAAPAGRVVSVSSVMHRGIAFDSADVPRPRRFDGARAYGSSKLAVLLFAYELDRRLRDAGTAALSLACHPGYTETDSAQADVRFAGPLSRRLASRMAKRVLGQTAEHGALPSLFAATADGLCGGEYIGPSRLLGLRGPPVIGRSSPESHDRSAAQQLWQISETLSGVRYRF
ncbi:MAG TPA: SDR family NAD(P)-dependent oxidoreductase, partial [Polyangiales bacterium]|nr:SDR family NAD(P)-dependent oxidoreductase [Polyangiales bacterium]